MAPDCVEVLSTKKCGGSTMRRLFWFIMKKEVPVWVCCLQPTEGQERTKSPPKPNYDHLPFRGNIDFPTLCRPSDSYQNILVMTDMFICCAWAMPTCDQTSKSTVHAIWSQIILMFGCPGCLSALCPGQWTVSFGLLLPPS